MIPLFRRFRCPIIFIKTIHRVYPQTGQPFSLANPFWKYQMEKKDVTGVGRKRETKAVPGSPVTELMPELDVRPEIKLLRPELTFPAGMYFDSGVHDAKALRYLIAQCGLHSVLLGSDFPFDMGIAEPVRFVCEAVSAVEQVAILEKNPKRFLNQDA